MNFLCTRVQEHDNENNEKIVMVMEYLQGTIVLQLILSIDNKDRKIKRYVDAEFDVNKDTRIHTGTFMTMGKVTAFVT